MILRNFEKSDIEQLQKHENSLSKADLEKLIQTWNEKKYFDKYFEMFAIIENGELIGKASLYERSEHIVSCGLELYPEFCGKGYGTQAYSLLLSFAKQKGFIIAVAQVHADNIASIALNRKMGFEAEDYTYVNKKGNSIYYFIKSLQ
ncbi:MAG: GNAT family N-acetyltransferase [Clostridia bacterium]|nr:GNAT family N-acetyltransferase [Clostridia bacterium]